MAKAHSATRLELPRNRVAKLARALLLLAFTATACGEGEPESKHRLVGTWEHDLELDPKWVERKERRRAVAGAKAEPAIQAEKEKELQLRITFGADGTLVMEGSVLGHPIRETCQWRVSEETAERITVEVLEPGRAPDPMTYVFVKPNVIRGQTKIGEQYFRRLD